MIGRYRVGSYCWRAEGAEPHSSCGCVVLTGRTTWFAVVIVAVVSGSQSPGIRVGFVGIGEKGERLFGKRLNLCIVHFLTGVSPASLNKGSKDDEQEVKSKIERT